MEIVNQLAGSLAQSASVTRQQSTDKSQQIRRAQVLKKDTATAADTFEHQVESCEELAPIHDDQRQRSDGRRKRKRANDAAASQSGVDEQQPPPHLDVKV
jgi:hypothetical protein